ncbi:MAG: KR domain-containing protein, partial [Acidobacteria bacterium]|nr:KR domain-containing protein [Acidobacteriota bacterium]
WNDWLNNHPGDDPLCQIIRKLQEIDSYGVEMMVFDADVSDLDRMTTVIRQAEKQLGPINGIFHTAGVIDYAGIIHSRKRQDTANILAPKVKGTLVLDHIFKDSNLDFLILFSSGITYAYHNSFGQIGYIAANDFLNAFTYFKKRHGKTMTISLNWADWRDVGMAIEAYANKLARGRINENRDIKPGERIFNPEGIAPHEGIDALCRIMDYRLPKIAISQFDVDILIEESKAGTFNSSRRIPTQKKKRSYNRDHLTSTYVAPRNDFERKITDIWQDLFGIDNVGIHDNFFEIGGDSLLSITFANRFTELIGETVYGTVVFDAQTIAQLAEYMKERYPSGTAKLLGTQQAILDIEKNDKKTEIDKKIVHQSKEELEKLLNGLDDMSTEQVDALLKEMITQKDGN